MKKFWIVVFLLMVCNNAFSQSKLTLYQLNQIGKYKYAEKDILIKQMGFTFRGEYELVEGTMYNEYTSRPYSILTRDNKYSFTYSSTNDICSALIGEATSQGFSLFKTETSKAIDGKTIKSFIYKKGNIQLDFYTRPGLLDLLNYYCNYDVNVK